LISSLLSIFFTMSGLWLSFILNVTSGATIILVAGTCFFISMGIERLLPKPHEIELDRKEG
jgi:zinc transport system permease protein